MNWQTTDNQERTLEFDFVRATENAALNSLRWFGRGDKNAGDAAACDAIYGVLDETNCRGTVIIGEGIKDDAPGIFVGTRLGRWADESPRFDIAIDPIDGTSNLANGLPNCVSVIAASVAENGEDRSMFHLPSFYSEKMAWGPQVSRAIEQGLRPPCLDDPVCVTLKTVAQALGKTVEQLVVCTMKRPRHEQLIEDIRSAGAALRLITDGDITAALAPSMPHSGVDLYIGIGGSPESVLAAAALKTLGGEILVRMWPHNEEERSSLIAELGKEKLRLVYAKNDLVAGTRAIFCATGISDSPLLPGIKIEGRRLVTSSLLLRSHSLTIRHLRAEHDLGHKTIALRSHESRHRTKASRARAEPLHPHSNASSLSAISPRASFDLKS
jgi:fructose-1,6-bisphosphatase II